MLEIQTKFAWTLITISIVNVVMNSFPQGRMAKIEPALAENYSVEKVNCVEPQTTTQMNYCSQQEFQSADQKLNRIYQKLIKSLSKQQRQRLISAQQAWLKFRDRSCEYEKGQFERGTLASSTYRYCLARITQQRIADIEGYLAKANQ
jgi:uncharacterized protein YecT (DUF1311 family)